jgi:hypothetical protein
MVVLNARKIPLKLRYLRWRYFPCRLSEKLPTRGGTDRSSDDDVFLTLWEGGETLPRCQNNFEVCTCDNNKPNQTPEADLVITNELFRIVNNQHDLAINLPQD